MVFVGTFTVVPESCFRSIGGNDHMAMDAWVGFTVVGGEQIDGSFQFGGDATAGRSVRTKSNVCRISLSAFFKRRLVQTIVHTPGCNGSTAS